MTSAAPEASEAVLSEASARALELPDLLCVVAEFAATDLGRSRLRALTPTRDAEQLDERRRRMDEITVALEQSRPVPSLEEPLEPLLAALAAPGGLEGRQLVRLGHVLGAVRRALDGFLAEPETYPSLALLAAGLEPSKAVDDLRREIETTLDARGEVRDDASPELQSLRARVRSQREQLYRLLGDYVERHGEELAEDTITLRDERLLVLLPAGSRGRLPGLVQGRSATGRSFYFEPLEAVEANNDLRQASADEAEERRRLIAKLVQGVSELADPIVAHLDALAELDLLCASHDFARTVDGHFAGLAEGELHLRAARHPLLEPALASARERVLGAAGHREPVVPLDLDLDEERRVLVVTGPNAGGKTVALKTVGLLAAMNQCGLAVPAGAESRLPIFDAIVATVGDEQDLLSDRSTFSGRLQRLAEAWQAAGPDSLVLLDELGSGTGPEEGAALSIALLEALVERGALGVIVTHLTPLAAAALDLDGAGCAAMEFDPHSKSPTFRLRPGPPAASEALALARRLGLPSPWLERAEELLGSEQRDLRRLLRELEGSREDVRRQRAELEVEVEDQRKLRRRLEQELGELGEERRTLKKRYRGELDQFRREVRARLESETERLREHLETGRRRGLAAQATEELFERAPESLLEPELPAGGEPGRVAVGDRVRHVVLGWEGRLEELDGKRATVGVAGK